MDSQNALIDRQHSHGQAQHELQPAAGGQRASIPMLPLTIRVACESQDCAALLEVGVPDDVVRLSPPSLVIRCAGCSRLLSVSLPKETYLQHQMEQLSRIQAHQEQLLQLQRLQNELQMRKESLLASLSGTGMTSQHAPSQGISAGVLRNEVLGGSQAQMHIGQQHGVVLENAIADNREMGIRNIAGNDTPDIAKVHQSGSDGNIAHIPTPENAQR
jgi:TolA-binding protein